MGAATASLIIDDAMGFDAGDNDCVVSNSRGGVASNVATLSIIGALPGDTNQGGLRNGRNAQILVDFLIRGGSPSAAYCAADMNQDGVIDLLDVPLFVSVVLEA